MMMCRDQGSVLLSTKFMPAEEEVEEPSGKVLAPTFVRVPADSEASEGKMVRFDCRVSGRPYPEVTWYLNGRPILDDSTHKILVNESGNHALMITSAQVYDSGLIQCVARNKGGEVSWRLLGAFFSRQFDWTEHSLEDFEGSM